MLVDVAVGIHCRNDRHAIGNRQRRLEAFGQALRHVGPDPKAIDHDLDRVLLAQTECGQFAVQIVHRAIDPDPNETLGSQVPEQVLMLALALANHWRQQHQTCALGQVQAGIDHLADGLGIQYLTVFRAARRADPGEHQAQVVMHLGHGADGRSRIVTGRLLLDRDRRTQAFDMVKIRLFHH